VDQRPKGIKLPEENTRENFMLLDVASASWK
jgi:hypothetical protein